MLNENNKDIKRQILILEARLFLTLLTIMLINKQIDETTYKTIAKLKREFLRKCG